jgi:transposase
MPTYSSEFNGINPEAYLTHVFTVIADYLANKVSDLLPWNVKL